MIQGREENDLRNYFTINLQEKYGTRPGSNLRPLDLQSDSHLLPDTLPTVLRGPVYQLSHCTPDWSVKHQLKPNSYLLNHLSSKAISDSTPELLRLAATDVLLAVGSCAVDGTHVTIAELHYVVVEDTL